jgi:hypothetical protein
VHHEHRRRDPLTSRGFALQSLRLPFDRLTARCAAPPCGAPRRKSSPTHRCRRRRRSSSPASRGGRASGGPEPVCFLVRPQRTTRHQRIRPGTQL